MLLVAHAIRPYQFANITAYPRALLLVLAADARQRMWTIVIASFLALLALAAAPIVLNRQALRATRRELAARPIRLGGWATGGTLLAVALGDAVAAVKLDPSLSEFSALSLAAVAMAGAMAGVILSATALRRTHPPSPDGAQRQRDDRQLGARVNLVLASLLLLAGFVVTALVAQFLAAFLLLLVY